jgi:hypothetical protein
VDHWLLPTSRKAGNMSPRSCCEDGDKKWPLVRGPRDVRSANSPNETPFLELENSLGSFTSKPSWNGDLKQGRMGMRHRLGRVEWKKAGE